MAVLRVRNISQISYEKLTFMPFAAIYTLIHAFLMKNSHTKAAQAVKKAAKEVVILKDDIDIEGPHLDEIIAQWKILKTSSCVSTFAFPKGLS